jgi:hypothetical protein
LLDIDGVVGDSTLKSLQKVVETAKP